MSTTLIRNAMLATLLLLLMLSCSDEQSSAPTSPPISPKPFEILFPTTPVDHDRRLPLIMTWKLNDSTISKVRIYYRPTDTDKWTHERTVSSTSGRFEFQLGVFAQKKYRFALSTENGAYWDSSAVVSLDWFPVMLVEPRAGELRLSSDVNRFKWVCFDDRIERVEVAWRPAGSTLWNVGLSRLAADSSLDWDGVPWSSGTIIDVAVRGVYIAAAGLAPTDWSIVPNVAFGRLAVTSPLPGGEVYRYLLAKITTSVDVPTGYGKADETVCELSTDGGTTWKETPLEWTVLQSATTQAYLRLRHDGMKRTVVSGPFSIVDRSSEYFRLAVGRKFKYYVFGMKGYFGGSDTTSRSWRTITILRERPGNGRTEFECSVLEERADGSSTSSTGLLWQQHAGQQMVGGDFEPFNGADVFGIHDVSVDVLTTRILYGTPPQLPISSTSYETRRGKGIVSKTYSTTETRIPPSGYGTMYRLVE